MNCRLVEIFSAQYQLMQRFHLIEAENGFKIPATIPIDYNDPHDQLCVKELAWRVTEEVGEVISTLRMENTNEADFAEEMADTSHFLVELLLVAGIEVTDFPKRATDRLDELFMLADQEMFNLSQAKLPRPSVYSALAEVVWDLADAMHELKNRPWKRKAVDTNVIAFHNRLRRAMDSFIRACYVSGITPARLHQLYFRKNEVNRTRQETGA